MNESTRRDFLKSLGAGAAALMLARHGMAADAPGASPASRPNILLVLTDDQGYGDLALHGAPGLRTPNIDRFAKSAIQFERFFVSPLCSPTRASLLTGRYALRCGVWGVTTGKETMRADEVTLACAMNKAGYRTGIFGKWHNGETWPYTPQARGFDEFLGFHNGHWCNYFDTTLLHGNEVVKTKGYITDVLADAALRFIEENRDRPFFCYVPFNAPHAPHQVPDKYFNTYKAMGMNNELAAIYGMCENLDDNFARLLAKLDELKLAENTIVIFLTDNGPNGDRYNGGMLGRKGSVDEGGSRVPCFMRWPAGLKGGRTIPQIAAHIDLMPTLLDLCGVPAPAGVAFDGRSLRPLLAGTGAAGWPERMLFTNGGGNANAIPGAVRTQRYRAVRKGGAGQGKGKGKKKGVVGAEQAAATQAAGWQLFDMIADPGQKTNIATDNPEVVKRLARAYDTWFADVTRGGLERMPIPVGYAEENPVRLPAPQAYFNGGIAFKAKTGWAHDWLTNWTATDEEIYWEIDVQRAGDYEIALGYLCPAEEAGSKVEVKAGTARGEATVKGTAIRQLPSPDRVPRKEVYEMVWEELPAGKMRLEKGRTKLSIKALSVAGRQVMDLKYVKLNGQF